MMRKKGVRIAENGYRLVSAAHTYRHRVRSMLETLKLKVPYSETFH